MSYSRRQVLGLAGVAAGCAVGAGAGIALGRTERTASGRRGSPASRPGEPLWRLRLPDPGYAHLTVAGDLVYVDGRDTLYALGGREGTIMWEAPVSQIPPVTHGDLVYTEGFHGGLSALSVADGAERWSFEVGNSPLNTPVLDGQVAYVGVSVPCPIGERGGIWALDTQTGTQLWQVPSAIDSIYYPDTPVAVAGDTLYTSSGDMMRALDKANGTERWRNENLGLANFVPQIIGDTVYGPLFAVSAISGQPLWTSNYPASIFAMEVVDSTIYVAGNNGTGGDGYPDEGTVVMSALEAANGKQVWTRTEDNLDKIFVVADGISLTCAHPATVSDGIAYSGGADGVSEFRANRLSDGHLIWQVSAPGLSLTAQPVLTGGYACLGFDHESVRLVSLKTGETRWDLPMTVVDGPIVGGNMVYTVTADAAGPGNDLDTISSKGYVYGIRL